MEGADFAALIQTRRRQAGLSQEELADAAGLSPRAISYLETGRIKRPRRATVAALATALALTDNARAAFLAVGRGPDDRFDPAPVRQLPPDITDFVGRSDLIDRVTDALVGDDAMGPPVVAICGMPGVGKSALAIHVGHRCGSQHFDGHLYVNLRGSDEHPLDPSHVQARFLRSLGYDGIPPTDPDECTGLYRSRTAERQLLVVLDDARDERQVQPLIPGSPGCAVIVTSRHTLALPAQLLQLEALPVTDAMTLFSRIVSVPRVDAEPDAARYIVDACGKLPLAIRIAATRIASRPAWSLRTVAERLDRDNFRLPWLHIGQLGVEASFQLSYDQLDAAQARAFRLLAMPPLERVREAAGAAILDVDEPTAARVMTSLADIGILTAVAPDSYRYHDLVRLYARSCTQTDDKVTEMTSRLLAFYLATIRDAWSRVSPAETTPLRLIGPPAHGVRFTTADDVREWAATDRSDLVAVLHQAASDPQVPADLLCTLVYGLNIFAALGHSYADTESLTRMAVRAAQQGGDDGAQAKARSHLAHVLFAAGQIEQAAAELSSCRSLIPVDTMAWLLAETSHLEGVIAFRSGDLRTARKRFGEAASIQRRLGDRLGEATVAGSIARIDIELGQALRAVPLLEESLRTFQDLGDSAGEIATGYHLGRAWESMDRTDDALTVYAECLRLAETGVLYRTGELLLRMGALHLRAQRVATAADLARRAVAFYRTRGEPLRLAEAHETLGRALIASGQEEQGGAELAQAAAFRARDGSDQMPA